MKPVIAFVALALPLFSAHAAPPADKGTQTRINLFDRHLGFTLPPGFVRVTDRNNGTNVLIEYVPKGQTVANWKQMVTIQRVTSGRAACH